MSGVYEIRLACRADLPLLRDIELTAARLLAGFAPESVLAEATPLPDLELAQRDGHLWVAALDDRPVGFAHVKVLEKHAIHLDELDVHPDHGRRGLGRRLVSAVCDWAAATGRHSVTLSTFREPRWNMPFYASLGFEPVPRTKLSAALRRVVADEVRRGLDPARRVVMRRQLLGRPTVLRVARPTNQLDRVTAMYTEGLGFTLLGHFADHDGFDGSILGRAGGPYHLEFTSRQGHQVRHAPTKEHLLIFYIANHREWSDACARMQRAGFTHVKAENPYWGARGRTFEDVEGYRVVLQNTSWPPLDEP